MKRLNIRFIGSRALRRSIVIMAVSSAACSACQSNGVESAKYRDIEKRLERAMQYCKIPKGSAQVTELKQMQGKRAILIRAGCSGTKHHRCLAEYSERHELSFEQFPLTDVGSDYLSRIYLFSGGSVTVGGSTFSIRGNTAAEDTSFKALVRCKNDPRSSFP